MNLHIAPDNTFVNTFYDNLREGSLLQNNRIVIRTNNKELKAVKHDVPFAASNSAKFDALVGDTFSYDKVYIHYLTPTLYRWIARNNFKQLSWMIWGGDLYNLSSVKFNPYEKITASYGLNHTSLNDILFQVKVLLTNTWFKKTAYAKINEILTWMRSEYDFALANIPSLRASHRFFFYENQLPYQKLDELAVGSSARREIPTLIIGNSGYPANNHLDVIDYLVKNNVRANLRIPVSYGNQKYIAFLKRQLRNYQNGSLEFIDRFMAFEEYVNFLNEADGLIMYNARPQGYGNIFMMLYLNKAVFFNERNISLSDLTEVGVKWFGLRNIVSVQKEDWSVSNRDAVASLLSHERLMANYRELFG